MARKLRFLPQAHSLVEVTTRTDHGAFLMTPTEAVKDVILGVIGRAQAMYGMVIHGFGFLSNHYHFLCSPADTKQQAQFFAFVNANIAKEVKRLVGWTGAHFWSRRYQAIVVSTEVEAQLNRLEYLLAQGTKEHLVERPSDWPGAHVARALLEGTELRGTWFDRAGFYNAQRRRRADDPEVDERPFKQVYTIKLTPLPCLAGMAPEKQRETIQDLLERIASKVDQERQNYGITVAGAAQLQQQDIESRPLKRKRSPAPLFHAFAKSVREQLRSAYRLFSIAFREAADKLKAGIANVRFPPGCYPPGLPYVSMNA
jgi:Transposase IS200 like